jgi:hypothetical protein
MNPPLVPDWSQVAGTHFYSLDALAVTATSQLQRLRELIAALRNLPAYADLMARIGNDRFAMTHLTNWLDDLRRLCERLATMQEMVYLVGLLTLPAPGSAVPSNGPEGDRSPQPESETPVTDPCFTFTPGAYGWGGPDAAL